MGGAPKSASGPTTTPTDGHREAGEKARRSITRDVARGDSGQPKLRCCECRTSRWT